MTGVIATDEPERRDQTEVWGGFAPAEVRQRAARRLRTLGHPIRLQALERLSHRPNGATVGELAGALGISEKAASSHLRALLQERLVTRAQEGEHARYRLADRDDARIGALSYRAVVAALRTVADVIAADAQAVNGDVERIQA